MRKVSFVVSPCCQKRAALKTRRIILTGLPLIHDKFWVCFCPYLEPDVLSQVLSRAWLLKFEGALQLVHLHKRRNFCKGEQLRAFQLRNNIRRRTPPNWPMVACPREAKRTKVRTPVLDLSLEIRVMISTRTIFSHENHREESLTLTFNQAWGSTDYTRFRSACCPTDYLDHLQEKTYRITQRWPHPTTHENCH